MEQKILALDLGSNSIGAAIRNPSDENQFEHATVLTFETGVGKDKENKYTISLAANRTEKRSIRRLYQARKYKLWAVLEALIKDKSKLYCPISEESLKRWKYYNKEEAQNDNGGRKYPIDDLLFSNWIKLDFNNDGKPDYISPYQLRSELATVKLDFSIEINRFKLGRALYHIAQHRGFKSSKIVQEKDDVIKENNGEDLIEANKGAEDKKQNKFFDEIEKLNILVNQTTYTVGMILAKVENDCINHPERKSEGIRIRKNLHQYVTRKMLIREVKQIFDFQGLDFKYIFDNEYSKSAIFWQRPLRSQKGLVGYCTLENMKVFDRDKGKEIIVGKKRCPISRPEFEEFRALSFINNIAYREKGNENFEWQFISNDMRRELYKEKFFVQKDFEFYDIYKWIKNKNKHDKWELNYNFKTNVSACKVSARLQKIFGESWNNIITRKNRHGNEIQMPFYENVWHVLFESDDEDFVKEYGKSKCGLKEEDKIGKLSSLWFAMPVGYAQLSLKAINNILPFLREGFIYTDAVLLGKVPEILGEKIWNEKKTFITESLKKAVIEKNQDEKRILNIVNSLIAQYKSLPKEKRFAERNYEYVIGSRDNKYPKGSSERDDYQIMKAAEDGYGNLSWKEISKDEKTTIIEEITKHYQEFFSSIDRDFYLLPRLGDAMKRFLADNFPDMLYCPDTFKKVDDAKDKCTCEKCKLLNKLYHPSMIAIYPEAREEFYKYGSIQKSMVMLGSPKTGSFKNPMAMRTLYELRKLVNYFIATDQIDQETRVVVEVGRELVDTNKRWAYAAYQNLREEENKEFADAIRELLKDPEAKGSIANADSGDDIDKFRLWYEMIESVEGFEKDGKFISVDEDRNPEKKNKKRKKNQPENDEESFEFSENHFSSIKKEAWVKLKKAKDNIVDKYRLWKEQQYRCIYTGKMIKITDLFKENLIDIEHTIPRSISFDNSLANKTVCYADFNRNTKKNRIPYDLDNYYEIKQRIEKWEQKVKDLETRVEFWKDKSKHASTPENKNNYIRQKHLWQFELDYWKNKVERFTMKEVKAGFKNSQLKDTQFISKYAFHYLKSYFDKVDVQKGEITAVFRKILNIQETGTEKDRSKHSHHAKDAVVLSIIPSFAIRDKMLEVWYKIKEGKKLLESDAEKNKTYIGEEIKKLEEELSQLINQCRLPKGLNNTIRKLDEELLINNIARNRSVIPASKKVRFNGKTFTAKGDAIRGELHLATTYGKIHMVERDNKNKPLKTEKGEWIHKKGKDEFKFVLNKEVNKSLIVDNIVDPYLKQIIKTQMGNRTLSATLNEDGGFFMPKKDGSRANKIRHIRCFADDVTDPVQVKPHLIQGKYEHKNYYWAKNGENVICAFYQKTKKDKKGNEKLDRELEIISLMVVADLVKQGTIRTINNFEIYRKDKNGKIIFDEEGNKEEPYAILKPGMKVIFYKKNIDELCELSKSELSKRIYTIIKFSGTRITFGFHLDARPESEIKKIAAEKNDKSYATGYSNVNFENPAPRYLLSRNSMNMAIEGKHFKVLPDGEIKWNSY